MRALSEWINVNNQEGDPTTQPSTEIVVDNAVASWSGIPYAELSVVLVHLRFLYLLHQTHHWVAKGDSFYGDHKLFQELYERTLEDVDDVAEKAVGLGCEQNVNLTMQLSQLYRLNKAVNSPQTVPQSSELARASLVAECNFIKVLSGMCDSLKQCGSSTPGVENLLQQIADRHEKHVYLLKRRATTSAFGM